MYINCAKIFTGRIIVEFFSKFKWLKSVIPLHILHICSKEMAQKSTIVSLPLLNKNWFMLSMRTVCISSVYRVMDAHGKFGEHKRSVRVARRDSRE